MTIDQLKQQEENSYLHAPDDGAYWRCDECKQLKLYTRLILAFVAPKNNPLPTEKNPSWICLNCIDESWIKGAKDCGTLE